MELVDAVPGGDGGLQWNPHLLPVRQQAVTALLQPSGPADPRAPLHLGMLWGRYSHIDSEGRLFSDLLLLVVVVVVMLLLLLWW